MRKTKEGQTKCTLDELNFPVEKVKQTDFDCNKNCAYDIFGYIGAEKTKKRLNTCSNIYELVPNNLIFPNVEAILERHGIKFEASYSHTNHARFYANLVITDPRYAYKMKGTSDAVHPLLRGQHSYNGLTKYKIIFGYFRVICTNGLTVPVQEMKRFNLSLTGKHTKSILHSLKELDTLLTIFSNEAKQITKAITDKFEILGGRAVVKLEDRVKDVLTQNKIGMIENQNFNTVMNIVNRINKEANDTSLGYKGRVNDWLVYNGINQYLNDDALNISSPEKRQEVDSKIFEYMLANAA